ncbi:MAG: glycosyltransferase family 2 protein [Rhodobacter sp.]|nr:glycosyltransferase family 2 protein [Rhodobacter sp.]
MSYTLVATAKNEGPYLLEWVAYHRMIGFDNILIFQNDSDDLTDETLKVLREIGAVDYRYNRAAKGRHQVRAYKRAARTPEFTNATWALALDLDEFLHIRTGDGHIDDLFSELPPTDMVLLNWRRFGNDGRLKMTERLVAERFLSAEPEERIAERLTPFKAMFRPRLFERCGVHQPYGPRIAEDRLRICNGSGLIEPEFTRQRFRAMDPAQRRLAQINHYITRDAASFVLKSHRGSAHQADRGIDKSYWEKRNFNDQQDDGLARRSDEIVTAMAELDAASGGQLEVLRLASLRLHLDRFEKLLKQPVYRDLYEFCAALAAA